MYHCNTCNLDKNVDLFGGKSKTFCKQCANEYAKAYREQNKNIISQKQKIWYNDVGREYKKIYDKEHIKNTREYEKNRYNNDMNYRMRKILRTRLYKTVKGEKTSKSLMKFIGISLDDFKKWIEYQMINTNYKWDNYGIIWEIDHVKPCSSFNLELDEDKAICFNWKNMRPLSKELNSIKSDNILDDEIIKHNFIVINYLNSSTKDIVKTVSGAEKRTAVW